MFELILVIHIIACISIIFFVLLQSGRGAELGAAFGSVGQANSVRGSMTGVGKITTEPLLIPEEEAQTDETPEIPVTELEQKVAPPIDSSSGN